VRKNDIHIQYITHPSSESELTGSISTPIITEMGGAQFPRAIRTDQDWQIQVNWELEGPLLNTPLINSSEGEWIIHAYLESMGSSKEYQLPEGTSGVRVGMDTYKPDSISKRIYSAIIQVAPKIVDPGIYNMVVVITYEISPGKPGPMAGFFESGRLLLYKE